MKCRIVIVRYGQLRAPLFAGSWDKVGPPLKLVIDTTISDIDSGVDPEGAYCLICRQRIWEYDGNTAFPVEVCFDDDGRVEVGRGGCCPTCSKLSDYELVDKLIRCPPRPRQREVSVMKFEPWPITIGIAQRDLKPDEMIDCGVKLVSGRSMMAVIERYNLEPDDEGNYRITDTMVDEAAALDKENDVTVKGLRFITTKH